MKRKTPGNGIVYSTDNNYQFESQEEPAEQIAPANQKLKIKLDKKNRGGKVVTIIEGFRGSGIEDLAKSLKSMCGTGGAAKDGEIIIQGDNRDKIKLWLLKNGYLLTT